MKKLILGTAGHIDHGKTALVRALTGVDTDRLPEEKQRGITIDLGFANLQLGDVSFGVVDVPGHEGFVRNMLAGATGMDAVLLVVAADEGVMPQTREHLAILDLLDVRGGVVAITKSDLVDEDWLHLVVDDMRATLQGTSLANAPILPVSARTGAGLDALRSAIIEQATRPLQRARDDVFRLPVDRVFTVHGTGTVVTGTVWSGELSIDSPVHVSPEGRTVRVRGIQVHGEAVDRTVAGERAAIAVSGVDKSAIERGHTLVGAPWPAWRMLTTHVRMIADTDWVLGMRQRVRVHIGTTEVLARAVLLDRDGLAAGASGWVQLRLEQPVTARVGDRIILRSYSPVTTIAGGTIAELSENKRTRIDAAPFDSILAGTPVDAVLALLGLRAGRGAAVDELALHTPHAPPVIRNALQSLGDDVVLIGDRVFGKAALEDTVERLQQSAEAMHARQPLRPALDLAELRGSLPGVHPDLVTRALQLAAERGTLIVAAGTVRCAGFEPKLNGKQSALRASLVDTLANAGLAAPTVTELGRTVGDLAQIQQLLKLLESEGVVRSVAPDLYIDRDALTDAEARTRRELAGASGLSAASFRATLPVSRKHLIPLLEYFDRIGITVRDGDLRSVPAASGNDLPGNA